MKAKKQKQGYNAELQPNTIYYTEHLNNFTSPDWRHTHTFTQNTKEMEVATSLWSSPSLATTTPSSSGVVRELVPRAGTFGPLDSTDGVLGNGQGFVTLSPRSLTGFQGLREEQEQAGEEEARQEQED